LSPTPKIPKGLDLTESNDENWGQAILYCFCRGTPLTGDVRDGMGKRRRAPHSKAAAAARNSQLPDYVRQPVRHPPVREAAPQLIAAVAQKHSPSAARRDALECGALRRFASRVAVSRESSAGRRGPARQASVRVHRRPIGQMPQRAAPERGEPGIGVGSDGVGRWSDRLRLVGVNGVFRSEQALCRVPCCLSAQP
jgi:hypothetical protein